MFDIWERFERPKHFSRLSSCVLRTWSGCTGCWCRRRVSVGCFTSGDVCYSCCEPKDQRFLVEFTFFSWLPFSSSTRKFEVHFQTSTLHLLFPGDVWLHCPSTQLHIQMYRHWTCGGSGTDWSVGGPFTLEPLKEVSCAAAVTVVTYHSKNQPCGSRKPNGLTHTPLLFHCSEVALLITVT